MFGVWYVRYVVCGDWCVCVGFGVSVCVVCVVLVRCECVWLCVRVSECAVCVVGV